MTIEKIYELDKILPRSLPRNPRPMDKCILFQDGKAIATNGHILAVVPVTDWENDTQGPIDPDVLREGRRQYKSFDEIQFSNNGNTVLKLNGATFPQPLVEGESFPEKWAQTFPPEEDEPVIRIGLNADLLKTLSDALGTEKLELAIYGPTRGILVTPLVKVDDVTRGLICPIRLSA